MKSSFNTFTVGLFVIALYIAISMFIDNRRLKSKLKKMTELRLSERKGRTNAEKLLRQSQPSISQQMNNNNDNNKKLVIVKQISIRIIGIFHSPFNDRRGTPRQGVLVPSAIGYIEFYSWLQPKLTLNGLIENFSHIWVIWQFHQNTNSIQQHLLNNNNLTKLGCKAKIKPPRLNGAKIGIFSCRTPHRPNPIGLTKCKIIKIDCLNNRYRLYLSDIDMMNNTPIIDIKPYIPYSDIQNDAIIPKWCKNDSLLFDSVIWDKYKLKFIMEILQKSKYFQEYFEDINRFKSMIEEILIRDIRSLHQRKSKINQINNDVYECRICDIVLKYTVYDNKVVTIMDGSLNNC